MWHAFDLMQSDIVVADGVRASAAVGDVVLHYADVVLARFPTKDKVGTDKQWKPQVDHQPGITITRRTGSDGGFSLELDHRIEFAGVEHGITATMRCAGDAWRIPMEWTVRQTLRPNPQQPPLPSIEERGSWTDGTLTRFTTAGGQDQETVVQSARLTALYALLASFPKSPSRESADFLSDVFGLHPGVTLAASPGGEATSLPPASALRACTLSGFGVPWEFWLNDADTVVYACQGPTRVLVLTAVEKAS